jgi:stage V sporulation protein AC
MEFRREGLVLGLGAKLFQLAGPVITYGVTTSIVIGLIYYVIDRWFA